MITKKNFIALLVDDNYADQNFFVGAISDIPVQCEFANSTTEALQMLDTRSSFIPDFIFIAIYTPQVNGMKCLSEIKKMKHLAHIPIYMYSAVADDHIARSCMALGATGVIQKLGSASALREILLDVFFSREQL